MKCFPTKWKFARCIMLSKRDKVLSTPLNYRSVSLLDSLAKLFEKKIVLKRFNSKVKELLSIYRNQKVTAFFATFCHLTLSWATLIQSTPSHHISLRSLLILSSVISVGNFLQILPLKSSKHSYFLQCLPHSLPIASTCILFPTN